MLATSAPYSQYFDSDGKPLDDGSIYFGTANQNPETTPATVYWDAAGTQPAAQPVPTLNGYTARNGTPALVYASGDYSLTVRNRQGAVVLYAATSAAFNNASIVQANVDGLKADLATTSDVAKGDVMIGVKLNATGSVARTQHDKNTDVFSVKDFGAKGDGVTDDTGAIAAAIAAASEGGTILFPASSGHYVFSQLVITKTVWLIGAGWHCGLQANFADASWSSTAYVSGSVLRSTYTGAGSAITCTTSNKGPRFKGLALIGPGSGTSTAITFGSLASYQVLGVWDDFFVANFYNGVVLTNIEDWTFNSLRIRAMSTVGLTLQAGGATVNVTQDCFYNLEIQRCSIGILATEASTIAFWGGLLQNITTPIKLAPSANGRVAGLSWHKTWFEANTTNVTLDLTNGGVQFLEFNGTNHNGSGSFFSLTNPSNNTVTALGLHNVAASGWALDLSPGASIGPAYTRVYGKGSQFASVTRSNAVPENEMLLSAPYTLLSNGIPFVIPSSGTMGNNGALSGITAVPVAYPSAYVYLPANAIQAGSAAGWYYAVFSSTTAATIYNNPYTSGVPTIPGSPTAFASTGPGAYTQTTGAYIPGPQARLGPSSLGVNGIVRWDVHVTNNNSGGNKYTGVFGSASIAVGTRFMDWASTTATNTQFLSVTTLTGSLAAQNTMGIGSTGLTLDASGRTTNNFGSEQYLQVVAQLSAATDTVTIEGCVITVSP